MKNVSKIFLSLIFLITSSVCTAQEKNKIEQKYEMKTYYMVFLKKGNNRSQDSATVSKLQTQHIDHLDKMAAEGKLDVAGPFMDNGDIRGICIYNVATKEEAEKLANEDPMVKAGRLMVEVHPFYSAKGATLK